MSATLSPALGQKINVAKLPPAEAITKHLSPIVMSQRYTGDGYLSESIGPVSFNEAALGLGGALAGGYFYFVRGFSRSSAGIADARAGTGRLIQSPLRLRRSTPL